MRTLLYILAALIGFLLLLPLLVRHETTIQITREGDPLPAIVLSLEGFDRIEQDRVRVYFSPSQQALAQDVAETLQEVLDLLAGRLGITTSIAVALFPREELEEEHGDLRGRSFVLPGGKAWPILVSQEWQRVSEGDSSFLRWIYSTAPHEATEDVVSDLLYHDRRARWVGDGLAEYAGYVVAARWAPSVLEEELRGHQARIETLLAEGKETYNLLEEFLVRAGFGGAAAPWTPVEYAGYSVSLAFWLDLAERYGEETIRAFWKRLSTQRTWCLIPALVCFGPNAETAAQILGELTGEDIGERLQRVDLQKALEILERAVVPAPDSGSRILPHLFEIRKRESQVQAAQLRLQTLPAPLGHYGLQRPPDGLPLGLRP